MTAQRRGFTLVELMVVVAIVGILAALAIYGLRRYLQSASAGEAVGVLQQMRVAEESLRAREQRYGGCHVGGFDATGAAIQNDSFYPRPLAALSVPGATSGEYKAAWDAAGDSPLEQCIRHIGFKSAGPVRFSYAASAGPGGTALTEPAVPNFVVNLPLTVRVEPWYVLVAAADRDVDGVVAAMRTTSQTTEVYVEQETE